MAGNFTEYMLRTVYCYKSVILPTLKTLLKSQYEIFSVENDSSEIAKLLDVYGGCDLLLLDKRNSAVEGIASRIQFAEKSFDTFTIRLERDSGTITEYEKRKRAMASGAIYPKFTFQAYVSKDMQLLSMAIIRTVDLYKFVEENQQTVKHTGEEQFGQASFIACKWQDLKAAGFAVSTFYTEENL